MNQDELKALVISELGSTYPNAVPAKPGILGNQVSYYPVSDNDEALRIAANRRRVSVRELLKYDGDAFVQKCYQLILRREPDPSGLAGNLTALRNGRSKLNLIELFANSEEGSQARVELIGLAWQKRIAFAQRWLRSPIRATKEAWRAKSTATTHVATAPMPPPQPKDGGSLNGPVCNVRKLLRRPPRAFLRECYQLFLGRAPDAAGMQRHLRALSEGRVDKLGVLRSFVQSPEAANRQVRLVGMRRARFSRNVQNIPIAGKWVTWLSNLGDARRLTKRVAALEDLVESQQEQIGLMEPSPNRANSDFDFSRFYLEFENRFRGSREEIRSRHQFYIPIIQKVHDAIGPLPVLDIACGRGEWLELLRDSGFKAYGVDVNPSSLAECRSRKLIVHEGDAFEYLRSIDDGKYLAVTAFHFVEHLQLADTMQLLKEIMRILAPGGRVLLETPNPGNLSVGAHTFHLDPTHKNPIPSGLLQFMLQFQGFQDVKIHGLQPASIDGVFHHIEGASVLNQLLFGFQDYAVEGTKQ